MYIVVDLVLYGVNVFNVKVVVVCVVLCEYVLPLFSIGGFLVFCCVMLNVVVSEVWDCLSCVGTYHAFKERPEFLEVCFCFQSVDEVLLCLCLHVSVYCL